jgi:peptidoglycan/LPS O-acetylase OafA/YrhL
MAESRENKAGYRSRRVGVRTFMIRSFEGLRGLAALGVASLHLELAARLAQSQDRSFLWTAYLLVDLFFVLSGFVIGRLYEERLHGAAQLANFIVRRTGRLYPLFVFSTLVYIALDNLTQLVRLELVQHGFAAYFHHTTETALPIPTVKELLASATLTHSLNLFDGLILNYPSWSISTEYYTYLVFGVCAAFLAARHRVPVYVLWVVIGTAVSVAGSLGHDCLARHSCLYLMTDLGIFRCLAGFFLGVLAARWARNARFLAAAASLPVQTAALLAAAVVLVGSRQAGWLAFFAPLTFLLLIVSVAADAGWVARLFGHRLPVYLGRISYSIYLMHAPLLLIFAYLMRAARGLLQVSMVAAGFYATLILVSHLTFRYIEDPLRVRANALADRWFFRRPNAS